MKRKRRGIDSTAANDFTSSCHYISIILHDNKFV